jgi:hypothetical protein
MTDQLKKTGVALVAENSEGFLSALNKSNDAVRGFGESAHQASGGVQTLGLRSIVLGNIIANVVQRAVGFVVGMLQQYGRSALDSAARTQELDFVLQILGGRAGKTKAEIDSMTASIVDYGIRTDEAQNLISQFIRYELDFSKAADLARVAQDTAVISMVDSSEELNRLLYGIQTYNSLVLRTAGINVSAAEAFNKYAAEIGKSSAALNQNERQQAMLNAVLEEGARNAGLYEAAMEAPGKQLRSFSRDMYELLRVAGTPFLGAMSAVVGAMRDTAKTWREAIDEGGRLHGIMMNLGAVASVIGEEFRTGLGGASNAIIDWIANISGSMEQTATSALTWGINIVTQLATGIITGAADALIAAMNFISNLLSGWLKGASPPKVAPDLPKWGMNAMAEWLSGFTQADFGALKGIQSPLKTALSILTQTGQVTAKEAADIYTNLSKTIAKSVASGNIEEGMFKKIEKAAGPFGAEVVKLAKSQLALAIATNKVQEAEKALQEARNADLKITRIINKQVEEYNNLLRAGADKTTLKAKLAQINAAEKERDVVREQAAAAEATVANSQEALQPLQEQVQLQQDILDQLFGITQEQLRAAQLAGAAGGGGGLLDPESLLGGTGTLENTISTALDDLKAKVKEKLKDLFQPVIDAWELKVAPKLLEFQTQWGVFTQTLKTFYDERVAPLAESLDGLVPPDLAEKLGYVGGMALVAYTGLKLLALIVGIIVSPLFLMAAGLALVLTSLDMMANPEKYEAITGAIADWLLSTQSNVKTAVETWLHDNILAPINTFINNLPLAIAGKVPWASLFAEDITDKMHNAFVVGNNKIIVDTERLKYEMVGHSIIPDMMTAISDSILGTMGDISLDWGTIWDTMLTTVKEKEEPLLKFKTNVLEPLAKGFDLVTTAIGNAIDIIITLAQKILGLDLTKLLPFLKQSPPPMAAGFNLVGKAVDEFAKKELPKLSLAMRRIEKPADAQRIVQNATTNYNRNIELNMGGQIFNNQMDNAVFEARVRRIIMDIA